MTGLIEKSPLVSIIVLNYNGKQYIENCLSSLLHSDFKNYEIIFVDNASTDGSADFVRKHFPKAKIIQTKTNLGFAEGNNIGARYSTGTYLIFLNNDTQVTPHWIAGMVESVQSDATVGLCGCKVLLLDRKNVIDVIGGFVCDIFGAGLNALGHLEIDNHQYDGVTEIFSIVGASLLIKRETFEKIGGFDSSYFLLGEDIDLSWRAQIAGYKIIVNPSAIVYHKSMGTIKRQEKHSKRAELRFLSERNTLRSLLKNYSLSTLLKVIPCYLILLLFEMTFFVIAQKVCFVFADIRSIIWNIRNFRETWVLHAAIQQIRVVKDSVIQKRMISQSLKVRNFRSLFKDFWAEH